MAAITLGVIMRPSAHLVRPCFMAGRVGRPSGLPVSKPGLLTLSGSATPFSSGLAEAKTTLGSSAMYAPQGTPAPPARQTVAQISLDPLISTIFTVTAFILLYYSGGES